MPALIDTIIVELYTEVKVTGIEPYTKVTGVEPCSKVTEEKFLEMIEPHNNCCHEPLDLNWPVS